MMKLLIKRLVVAASVFCSLNGYGQNQGINNHWIMGYSSWGGTPYGHSRIDFFSGNPVITFDSLEMDLQHTHANMSDAQGNLLFYTNGVYIADATHDTMMNGSGLNPSAFTTYASEGLFIPQAALALKRPGFNSLYDLFHGTWDNWPSFTGVLSFFLYHSVIDMSLNNGKGVVIVKNQILINDSLVPGKLSACKHANGRDWWITCLKSHSDVIYKILLTPVGISSITTQNIGSIRFPWYYGQAKFSPNGEYFALFNPQLTTTGKLEIFQFDRCSGMFANPDSVIFTPTYGFNCGLEFSPNSEYLYVTTGDSIFQFESVNITTTKIPVAAYDGFFQPGVPILQVGLCFPQLAPDGKIYITSGNSTAYMGRINNPDLPGLACDVAQHSVLLPAYYYNTLPNHPNYFLGKIPGSPCDTILGLGIEQVTAEGTITAQPNPSSGSFTLRFPVQSRAGELEVYDVNGRKVHEEYVAPWSQFKRVDITAQPQGMYLLKLKWSDKEYSVKAIKQEE
jgi:hypothetical protein